MNLADIIAFIIVIFFIGLGAKKGLVKTAFSLGSLVLSLILALTLYPIVSDMFAESTIGKHVHAGVVAVFDGQSDDVTTENAGDVLKIPEGLQSLLIDPAENAVNTAKESIAQNVADLAINLLSMIIVFVLTKVILWILLRVFNAIAHLPILRSFNKLLGGLVGAIYGLLVIYLLLALLTFTTTLQVLKVPTQMVLDSAYVSTMYHDNIILNILK